MFRYVGGKSKTASWIFSHFPEEYPGLTYVEPFGGAGWVLYAKKPSRREVYNDYNYNLYMVFKVLSSPNLRQELVRRMKWLPHSRELFDEFRSYLASKDFSNFDPVYHAMAVVYLQQTGFGGQGAHKGFWPYKEGRTPIQAFVERVATKGNRFNNLITHSQDYTEIIAKYDGPNTLFYCDPPYIEREYIYKQSEPGFTLGDHKHLAKMLNACAGQVVLSYYDHPLVDELYPGWERQTKEVTVHTSGIGKHTDLTTRPKATELLLIKRSL